MRRFLSMCSAFVLMTSIVVCQNAENSSTNRPKGPPIGPPINLLVLGDSLLWGEGLKTEHKSWSYVKTWIEKNTGRPVVEKIEAHSGAVVENSSVDDNLVASDGEVNLALPTLGEQVNHALQFYGDGSKVDLVLVNGCVNDIGVQNLMNATTVGEITRLTEVKCGAPMRTLLKKITISFPNANVIVAGYYLFFSDRTRNDFVFKSLARRFLKLDPAATNLANKESFQRVVRNSSAWRQSSNKALGEVVENANAELRSRGSIKRVIFTDVQFAPECAFAAHGSFLWGFDRSPFRMMLAVISLGKILLPSNDEVRGKRNASCKEVFKQRPNESPSQEQERRSRLVLCRYASLGHPNRKGAMLYSDAIIESLKTLPRAIEKGVKGQGPGVGEGKIQVGAREMGRGTRNLVTI